MEAVEVGPAAPRSESSGHVSLTGFHPFFILCETQNIYHHRKVPDQVPPKDNEEQAAAPQPPKNLLKVKGQQ